MVAVRPSKRPDSRSLFLPAFFGALLSVLCFLAPTRTRRPQLTHLFARHTPLAPAGHKIALATDNTSFDNPWPSWTGTASLKDIVSLVFSREYIYSLLPSSARVAVDIPHFPDFTSALQATWLGHAGLFVQQSNLSYLVDPLLSRHVTPLPPLGPPRISKAPFESYEALASASRIASLDFVLLSHSHYDHFSVPDILEIEALWSPHYYVPYGLDRYLTGRPLQIPASRITQLVWWERASHSISSSETSAVITLTPSQHWSRRGIFDKNLALYGGFTVETLHSRAYFVGDSGYTPDLFDKIGDILGPFDFAAIPIGAYAPRNVHNSTHMDPQEALRVHSQVRSKSSIGIHWGTFRLTTEPVLEPRNVLLDLIASLELEAQNSSSELSLKLESVESDAEGRSTRHTSEKFGRPSDFRCVRPGQVVQYVS